MEQDPGTNNCNNESESLEEAFQNFSQATNYLTEFYKGLEQQVAQLNAELLTAKIEKDKQFDEKERLANRLADLLHVLPAGVIVLDGNGNISQANPAAIDLLGSPLEGILWRDVVERAFSPRWDDGHDITLKDGRYVNISTQSLESEPGQILLIKDVSENRQLQEQFSHLKRLSAMGEMAASLAHQVRTPLSSAILYASNLCRNGLDKNIRQRFSGKLLSRLQNLEALVEDMLLFSRGGRFDSQQESLNSLIDDLDESLRSKEVEYGCKINIDNQVDTAVIDVNKNAIISSIHNLVTNAVQSTNHFVEINIHCTQPHDNYIQFDVEDNGDGIPEDIQDRLFEPFFTTRSQGTGLGLAVVDAVVRAHNGTLTFETEERKGTMFHIQLPVIECLANANEESQINENFA